MTVTNISRVQSIALKLPAADNSIITVYSNTTLSVNSEFMPNYTIVSVSCFIKNLKVFASVSSLSEAPLPDFALDDSATTKLTKTIDVEWKSPRKQLNLYITNVKTPTLNNWLQIGSVSLLNPYGYPFRVYNLMDLFTDNLALELGENGKIGVQVEDVGYNLLTDDDKVTIHGSYVEEIFVQSPDLPNIININLTGLATGVPNQPTDSLVSNENLINNSFLLGN